MASVSFSAPHNTSSDKEEDTLVRINPIETPVAAIAPSRAGLRNNKTRKRRVILFDRASPRWWNPKFDSAILEEQYERSTFPQMCQRFQYSLIFLFCAGVANCVFGATAATANNWIAYTAVCLAFTTYTVACYAFTFTDYYQAYHFGVSMATACILCFLSLVGFAGIKVSAVGMFSVCSQIILLLYTVVPLSLYWCVLIGGAYTIVYELLFAVLVNKHCGFLIVRLLLHCCLHLVSVHTLLMAEIRMRNTFMKVGQSLLVRRELEIEKHIKEKMIHSVMPPKVADWLMSTQEEDGEDVADTNGNGAERRVSASPRQSAMIFRPFNMHCMADVSILFADIVGFTQMSSNKTAEQLVGLLNDLFGRFDYLCAKMGCEKISTLGDCYYCVAGCPDPRPDHARCCVEMGLGMIKAIAEFDSDVNENVNMRVGIHTGTVLCGIVGTYRFKFDVWSNDVTYANLMESTGQPGKVHISETTRGFIEDSYNFEEGLGQKGRPTYFIRSRKQLPLATIKNLGPRHSWPTQPGARLYADGRKRSSQSDKSDNLYYDSCNSSRKDSGIRSRHSSLQDVVLDTSSIRMFAGGFVLSASQSSIADTGRSSGSSAKGTCLLVDPNLSLNQSLARLRHLRKQSDLQLIRCVQQDAGHQDYFVRPPVNRVSLFFQDDLMEEKYRKRFHFKNPKEVKVSLSSATLNTYCDIFVSAFFFLAISVSCFITFSVTAYWLGVFALGTLWQLFICVLCLCEIFVTRGRCKSTCMSRLYKLYTTWYPWHMSGALLVVLPVVSVFSNFSCPLVLSNTTQTQTFCFLVVVSQLHFCNFAQLNCWLKSLLCAISGTAFVLLLGLNNCESGELHLELSNGTVVNSTDGTQMPPVDNAFLWEIILDVTLLVLLVWFLNREFEISYRLSFHGSILAVADKRRIQIMKNQADWLLHNIIPRHVAEQLKSTSKYSENHKDAGILFASIVNFNEMYEESFEGGKEYLRILHQLVGDFDELLKDPLFRNVEKIKTIGSTFMAASGLNQKLRQENPHPNTHLFELLDFAIAMQKVIEKFNYDLLEFNFILRIGYNFGDVTAGVIGTTKLYYDIWGDAVNTASRMDSTGVACRIQLPEHCVDTLRELYEFEPRGGIYVKGKDTMNVYLLKEKKETL